MIGRTTTLVVVTVIGLLGGCSKTDDKKSGGNLETGSSNTGEGTVSGEGAIKWSKAEWDKSGKEPIR